MTEAVIGLKALSDKLELLKRETGVKVLRSAAMASVVPTVKEMQSAAPKGKSAHRTFKGRLVAPGFLSRSVKRASRVDKNTGVVSVSIGVRREAFYGVTFLDKGTSKIAGRHWFQKRFEANSGKIVGLFKQKLAERIKKVAG